MTPVMRLLVLKEDVKVEESSYSHNGGTVYIKSDVRTYLDITGDDRFGEVALSILRGRFATPNERFPAKPPILPKYCSYTKEQWEKMEPGEPSYDAAKEEIERSAEEHKKYVNEVKDFEALNRCLVENDTKLAVAILEQRRHLPNEGYEIVIVYDSYHD